MVLVKKDNFHRASLTKWQDVIISQRKVTVKHAVCWTLNDRANFVSRKEYHGHQVGNY